MQVKISSDNFQICVFAITLLLQLVQIITCNVERLGKEEIHTIIYIGPCIAIDYI